ncbi:hypothetical protein B0H13DRAFT_1655465 [Mycena leptocephala]|nr:hypothetical protein B0H13DRAFT_1655465 [Mycena leptocephala]
MLSLNKISVLVAVLLAAAKVNAQDFAAFTGTACDGNVGLDVACDGTCFDFTGRHSFEASAGCTSQDFPFGREVHGACIDVQTGTPVKSFRCVHL